MDLNGDELTLPAAAGNDCAGGAALGRGISNTASEISSKNNKNGSPKPKDFLRFGPDWLTVNFMKIRGSKFIESFDDIFKKYNPESPYEVTYDIPWVGTNIIFPIVKFGRAQGDIVAYFKTEYDGVITVKKITPETKLRGISHFQYRITFYGTFFALEQKGSWLLEDFLRIALEEMDSGCLLSQVATIHVCADIAGTTTDWFDRGIKRLSGKLKKRITRQEEDPVTGLYDTINFGKKFAKRRKSFQATDWGVVGYDKLKSIRDEGDEGIYPQYLHLNSLLRVEAFFNSIVFRKYTFTLYDCLDKNALFALMSKFLRSEDIHFKVIGFLEEALKKNENLQIVNLERVFHKSNPSTDEKKRKRLLLAIHRHALEHRQTDVALLKEFLIEVQAPNYLHRWP